MAEEIKICPVAKAGVLSGQIILPEDTSTEGWELKATPRFIGLITCNKSCALWSAQEKRCSFNRG